MTPRSLILETIHLFREAGIPDPETDAALLLEHLTGRSALSLRTDANYILSDEIIQNYNQLRQKRLQRVPLQHLTHEQFFRSHIYYTDSTVLIPRPQTVELVNLVLQRLPKNQISHILDLCCGSGCIGIEISLSCPLAKVICTDVSPSALATASKNAEQLNSSVQFVQSDLFSNLLDYRFDVIISNPPYIPRSHCSVLQQEVRFEPLIALDGGEDGLDFYRKIISFLPEHLNKGGLIAFETGYDQAQIVATMLKNAECFNHIEIHKDFNGIQRMVLANLN